MKKFATLRNFLFTTLVCILIVLSLGYSYMILSLAVKRQGENWGNTPQSAGLTAPLT